MQDTREILLRRAERTASELGFRLKLADAEHRSSPVGDIIPMHLEHPGGRIDLAAQVVARPTRETVEAIAGSGGASTSRLVIADYLPPKLAERLRAGGVNFVDSAGNAFLRDRGLYVWVKGEKGGLRLVAERERRRAFQPSGAKLLFLLLCRPELAEADYRTLAELAGVALGTVQWVMRDLIAAGYVMKLGRSDRRLVRPKELLSAWVSAYVRELRPRLLLGRFHSEDLQWWQTTDLRALNALWSGEPAAALLTGHLKPGTLTIYAEKVPSRLVVEKRLTKAESGAVEFRKKFWRFDGGTEQQTVPPILAYADLLAVGDPRTREAAERLYEERIDGPFNTHLARWDR
ncbi:MAG: hypothetical protein KDD47_21145 [Acidobacteria bacterium]|nr:hypothetical protein [Acidobacteriota bacterium]